MLNRNCSGAIMPQELKRVLLNIYGYKKAEFFTNHIFKRNNGKPINFSLFLSLCTNR